MSLKTAWKQNILVTDFHLLKSLLVVFGFGSQAFVCGFSRQNICSKEVTFLKFVVNQSFKNKIVLSVALYFEPKWMFKTLQAYELHSWCNAAYDEKCIIILQSLFSFVPSFFLLPYYLYIVDHTSVRNEIHPFASFIFSLLFM